MLTLKVVTTDLSAQSFTHLYFGDSIIHSERETNDYDIRWSERIVQIGSLKGDDRKDQKPDSPRPFFLTSFIQIYDGNGQLKTEIAILPHADCYVMENGKTVDQFYCIYR
jgi:hypothetical protein